MSKDVLWPGRDVVEPVGCGKGRNKCAVAKVVTSCPKTASLPVGDYLHADQRA